MSKRSVSQIWFGVTALLVLVVIPIQSVLAAQDQYGTFSTATDRVINVFCYFTILSNVLAGVTSFMLARKPEKDSLGFNVARLDALVCISVTGLIYHALLASENLHGVGVYTNQVVHTAVPLLYLVGWLIFGPRGRTSVRSVGYAIIAPVGWAAFALIRGTVIHFYPYDFMDVKVLGYPTALLNMAVITALFIALFFGAHGVDKFLTKRTKPEYVAPNEI